MLFFENDYSVGAHESVLKALVDTNDELLSGYCQDAHSERAKELIKTALGDEKAEVFILTGGTQTNALTIDSLLISCEGVIAVESGHVNTHEAGAIELTRHKVLTLKGREGKLMPKALSAYLEAFYHDETKDHSVQPGMVYITYPSEEGTLYSLSELKEIHFICKEYSIPLYADGARLAYALASAASDLTIKDLYENTDAFYIGGTKCGALSGEALVFHPEVLPRHFFSLIKQHGALMAKGRLNAVQFEALFTNGLYFEIGKNAVRQAEKIKKAALALGFRFAWETMTNQLFLVLSNKVLEKFRAQVCCDIWALGEEETIVRLVTSWATKDAQVDELIKVLSELNDD